MLNKSEISELQKNSENKQEDLSPIFNALSDSGRLQIFKILQKNNNICVSDVAKILNVSVPAASRQLKILEIAGLIKKTRNGQMICFKVNKDNKKIKAILNII